MVTSEFPQNVRLWRRSAPILRLLTAVFVLGVGACASHPPQPAVPSAGAAPPPSPQVYFYPLKGQNAAQQDRDRYECYLWAMKQTGFDPSLPQLAPHQKVEVVPVPPPGHDTAVGAATGAVLGAVVSPPGRTAQGAVLGAVAGAAIGAASDTARQREARRLQERYNQRAASIDQRASDYRRAMTACLEGRGYSVR